MKFWRAFEDPSGPTPWVSLPRYHRDVQLCTDSRPILSVFPSPSEAARSPGSSESTAPCAAQKRLAMNAARKETPHDVNAADVPPIRRALSLFLSRGGHVFMTGSGPRTGRLPVQGSRDWCRRRRRPSALMPGGGSLPVVSPSRRAGRTGVGSCPCRSCWRRSRRR